MFNHDFLAHAKYGFCAWDILTLAVLALMVVVFFVHHHNQKKREKLFEDKLADKLAESSTEEQGHKA